MTKKYTVNDLSTLLNKHRNTIDKYLKELLIEPIKEGNRNLYTEEQKQLLEQHILETENAENELVSTQKKEENNPQLTDEYLEKIIEKVINRTEQPRVRELEKLINEALEREKKLEQLLHQQQELHNKTLQKLREKEPVSPPVKQETDPQKKELPYFVVDESRYEDVDEDTEKRWWERFKK